MIPELIEESSDYTINWCLESFQSRNPVDNSFSRKNFMSVSSLFLTMPKFFNIGPSIVWTATKTLRKWSMSALIRCRAFPKSSIVLLTNLSFMRREREGGKSWFQRDVNIRFWMDRLRLNAIRSKNSPERATATWLGPPIGSKSSFILLNEVSESNRQHWEQTDQLKVQIFHVSSQSWTFVR